MCGNADETKHPIRTFNPDTLSFDQQIENIDIEMRAVNYNKDALNYYTYKLVGYDDTWSEPGQSPVAGFTKLPGGEYTFKYRVANKSFNWADGKPLVIKIRKSLWEQSVFSGFHSAVWFWTTLPVLQMALAANT